MSVLHITNGDGAANIIKASTIEGDVLAWRDPMHFGPFPLGPSFDELGALRAKFLSGPGIDYETTLREFRQRDDHLKDCDRYNEIILWFEHDLLDQLQILQLLDWFQETKFNQSKLSLVCIDQFEGLTNFRGLGELTPLQIATLKKDRQPVTGEQIILAAAGWRAFRSDNPRNLEDFIAGNLSVLPFLARALRRHLQEYPWLDDGLTRTERQLLQLASRGIVAPGRLFVENMRLETALYLGDWSTFRHLDTLCRARQPLLQCTPGPHFEFPQHDAVPSEAFRSQRLELTEHGRRLLAGETSARSSIERNLWLGGVHLQSDQAMWMWDEQAGRLEHAQ
ncbi:MAG: hypothetical protein JXQ99_09165 [Hyphomicrobiaceae bacterium]